MTIARQIETIVNATFIDAVSALVELKEEQEKHTMTMGSDIIDILKDTIDERLARNTFWKMLSKANKDYTANTNNDSTKFMQYLEESYGIKVTPDSNGMITDRYEIIDTAKYVFFELKYG